MSEYERKGVLTILKDYGFNTNNTNTKLKDLLLLGKKYVDGKALTKKEGQLLDSVRLFDTSVSVPTPSGTEYSKVSIADVYSKLSCTDFWNNPIVLGFLETWHLDQPKNGDEFAKFLCVGILNANLVSEQVTKTKSSMKTDQFLKDSKEGEVVYEKYELDWRKHKCNNFRNFLDEQFFLPFKAYYSGSDVSYFYQDSKTNTVYDVLFRASSIDNSVTLISSKLPLHIITALNEKIAQSVNRLETALNTITEIELATENQFVENLIFPTDGKSQPVAPFFILTTFFDIEKKLIDVVLEDATDSTKGIKVRKFLGLRLKPKNKADFQKPNGYVLHMFNHFENFLPYLEQLKQDPPKLSNDSAVFARNHFDLKKLGLKDRFTTLTEYQEQHGEVDELKLRNFIVSELQSRCPKLWEFYSSKLCVHNLLKRLHFNGQILDETCTSSDALVLAGEGGDGKSTDIDMLTQWLKKYNKRFVGEFDTGLLLHSSGALGSSNWWTHRLLTMCEVPEELFTNENFKKLTGGDSFSMDVKFLSPICASGKGIKVAMTTNSKIVANDPSIRRRLIILYYRKGHKQKDDFLEQDKKLIIEEEYDCFIKLCWTYYCLSHCTKRNGGLINYCEDDFKQFPNYDSDMNDALLSIRAISNDAELKAYQKGILTGDYSDTDLSCCFANIADNFLKSQPDGRAPITDLLEVLNDYVNDQNSPKQLIRNIAECFNLRSRKYDGIEEYEKITINNPRWKTFIKFLKTDKNIGRKRSTSIRDGVICNYYYFDGVSIVKPNHDEYTTLITALTANTNSDAKTNEARSKLIQIWKDAFEVSEAITKIMELGYTEEQANELAGLLSG